MDLDVKNDSQTAVIRISCPDHEGITASVTRFVAEHRGNILHSDQHIDDQSHTFFMRIEWDLKHFDLTSDEISPAFQPIAEKFHMCWDFDCLDKVDNLAIFVSRHLHCLQDLLYRYQSGQLPGKIQLIISNHQDAQGLADYMQIPFYHFPITAENKQQQELEEQKVLEKHHIDLIALARYHQILSEDFTQQYQNRIINIHHSFLPAFEGRKPYHQAYEKGVKIIGATAHYVTPVLDQGPIIEQDTVRISHRSRIEDLIRVGEDLEKVVFQRAIRWHLQKKILCYGAKTVVFE